ncbi:hypothetical protein [Stratiformator vulcanicus]|uniref:Uncharacterized protein n=1 Tax=Stratiformator vulcanicus TaxID=2527980 RepID=A0A517R5X9_9PLAN|nr:hypothetical protein [Stratiformator vulcanicus]QDT39233.1 hypothetical protein Pan189_36360 [Stratiformator vulcanicus]
MSDAFREASEAAEQWTLLLADIRCCAERGDVGAAFGLMYQLRSELTDERRTAIEGHYKRLAAVADSVITHHGYLGSRSFPSAHAAMLEIACVAVTVLLGPLSVDEQADAFDEADFINRGRRLLAERSAAYLIDAGRMQASLQRERAKLAERDTTTQNARINASTKRRGRPSKGESDKETLIIAALSRHHGYDNGSLLNDEPIAVKSFADLPQNDFSAASLSRFFEKHFSGYKGYKAQCVNGKLAMTLSLLNRELPSRLASYEERDPD